jgi:hypothetical protein
VTGYLVRWEAADGTGRQERQVTESAVRLDRVATGTTVSVKALNAKGLAGWDWARYRVE